MRKIPQPPRAAPFLPSVSNNRARGELAPARDRARERELSNSKSTKTYTIENFPRHVIESKDVTATYQRHITSPAVVSVFSRTTLTTDTMPSPAMSAKPSSGKAGEPSSVHCPSSTGNGGPATTTSVTDTSPPAKRAKIADFATALMRACSVELPPGEGEDRVNGGEKSVKAADAKEGNGMECGVFPERPIFKDLGKMPTEKIINDW